MSNSSYDDNSFTYSYSGPMGYARVDHKKFLESRKSLLKQKQQTLKELQADYDRYVACGAEVPDYIQKRITRLTRDIIPDLKSSIAREECR